MLPEYLASLKNINLPLRLLVENEIFRLTVWSNPANEAKRGADHIVSIEKTMVDVRDLVLLVAIIFSCSLAERLDQCNTKNVGD